MRRSVYRRNFRGTSVLIPLFLLLLLFLLWRNILSSSSEEMLPDGIVEKEEGFLEPVQQNNQNQNYQIKQHLTINEFTKVARQIIDGSRRIGEDLEVHLFVIWQNAYNKRNEILKDIQNNFVILDLAEYDWDATSTEYRKMLINLWILYNGKGGWKKDTMNLKMRQCGYGKFTAILIADLNPRYANKHTAHGSDIVNVMMHSKKTLYRLWTGGGFKLHGTFSIQEANHDIRLLFHNSLEGVLQKALETNFYNKDIVSSFLSEPTLFTTRREVYGFKYEEGDEQTPWSCSSLIFALGALSQIRIADERTGATLWMQHSSPPGVPLTIQTITNIECTGWPEELLVQVPASDMWGVIALLQALPVKTKGNIEVTLNSRFRIELEGSTRILQFMRYD